MLNKKFVYGLGIGLLGSKLYPNVKNNIKPITIKLIKNIIILKENTKLFINELTVEAKKETNNIYDKELKKDKQDELTLLEEEQNCSFNRIIELKRQLEDVSQKIDNL
jgi:polyhydroxyalkanoate synthesis regulator phasin